jgi:SAM-dependent MidA family methyltransferase
VEWKHELGELTGVLLANEWLDNVPLDIAELDEDGTARMVTVNPATGAERLGEPVGGQDADWIARWWPLRDVGDRAEIGHTREAAWFHAVSRVHAGLALAIDYGHRKADRPALGSITGYRAGGQVTPIPDGSCDITAGVAVDAVAATGQHPSERLPPVLIRQRTALKALGVASTRPPRELASENPTAYIAALGHASQAAELIDSTGLGSFWWLAQPIKTDVFRENVPSGA